MKIKFLLNVSLVFLSSCSHFFQAENFETQSLWSSEISEKVKLTIQDYQTQKKISQDHYYGNSMRNLDLRNLCPQDIDAKMKALSCPRTEDVLKEPKHHTPLKTKDGKTILMIVYTCPDGGNVRVKPNGDPTSRFRPQPQVSKSLRYPYDSKFENFDDEVVKVDNEGQLLPKGIQDLNLKNVNEEDKETYIKKWADRAHTDLRSDCALTP